MSGHTLTATDSTDDVLAALIREHGQMSDVGRWVADLVVASAAVDALYERADDVKWRIDINDGVVTVTVTDDRTEVERHPSGWVDDRWEPRQEQPTSDTEAAATRQDNR